ncbi:MAG: TonB-dependent receptor plug domain-containing protein [Ferruginibacter sp.]
MKHYYRFVIFIFIILFSAPLSQTYAQKIIKGKVVSVQNLQPLEGVTVTLLPEKISVVTDQLGNFIFKKIRETGNTILQVSTIGYEFKQLPVEELYRNSNNILLATQNVELKSVIISSRNGDHYKPISKTDIAMRGVNNSQEILRIIPGIVIGQHQGGGKAEQIFLRGFDADHGTDFRLEIDGMPVNMVSHAHGQGFADSHFLIPETVDNIDFKKGPYAAEKGDFATAGFVDFNTRNSLNENMVKLEAGQFNTYRAMGMFKLLGDKARSKEQSWYVASEYRYSDAYFDSPQHFKRFNLFTKYNGKISGNSYLSMSANTFWSKWNASGQVPDRAVDKGLIGFYGAIDPNEGGITYRTNFNAQLLTSLNNGDIIKNQLYYSNAHFDLHTNFTFFLEDSVNGDQIRQKEARSMAGYNGSYHHTSTIGKVMLNTEAGLQVRYDMTRNSELSHTKNRYTLLLPMKLGDITSLSISPYISETFKFNEHFSINAGLRLTSSFINTKINSQLIPRCLVLALTKPMQIR